VYINESVNKLRLNVQAANDPREGDVAIEVAPSEHTSLDLGTIVPSPDRPKEERKDPSLTDPPSIEPEDPLILQGPVKTLGPTRNRSGARSVSPAPSRKSFVDVERASLITRIEAWERGKGKRVRVEVVARVVEVRVLMSVTEVGRGREVVR
jgi:hypothetical protein